MRIRTLLAILAFIPTGFLLPAAADSTVGQPPAAAAPLETISPQACPANAKDPQLAQLNCCKDHKGLCGCRAGKIVCCDGKASTHPGCTCHGDEGLAD